MKTATLNMRVDPRVKEEAERVYAQFGMNLTDAVNVFLHKSIMEGGLPFDLRPPRYNAETELAMHEAREIAAGRVVATRYASAAQAFADVADE
ncbi:type II toxin-antitoxin system RelB/DinJ family antitoxin [Schaalia meyeri]|uniref:type II toxin-antitoxin system RelB/DinJ family antitoxin n=1 Tax=Schaalia meyeri TaxID=52773 RepID=UPI002042FE9B|nr:type II toxin-antitoxin system RelB/DinJ family antitoxin [Schaalia meyeri]MCM3899912.1 type II toxin-antitoxin system RelB/DinJ family antitoxin [Schaalia meyeri]